MKFKEFNRNIGRQYIKGSDFSYNSKESGYDKE